MAGPRWRSGRWFAPEVLVFNGGSTAAVLTFLVIVLGSLAVSEDDDPMDFEAGIAPAAAGEFCAAATMIPGFDSIGDGREPLAPSGCP